MPRLRLLFAAAVFLAAFLLFLVEPIAAKQLLPVLGGSASVWITCLVFFQTALLAGYLYAHWLAQRPRRILYATSLAVALASPIVWATSNLNSFQGSEHPIWTVFKLLTGFIGLPFLMLAATSPLLQAWWAQVEHGTVPYRLYALSNLASLLALALYPSFIEPYATLHQQRWAWCIGFILFALLAGRLAYATRHAAPAPEHTTGAATSAPAASLRDKLLWVLLPMGAAMQLCTVTAYLTANVAAIPLLWILPLAVYLITIILAFQFRARMPWSIIARFLVVLLGALAYSLSKTNASWPLWVSLLFFLAELFFACFFLHTAAYALRPLRSSQATLFYLFFAAGGALGSFLIGIASPAVFNVNLDLPLTFLATALLVLAVNWQSNWSQRMLWIVACVLLVVVVFMVRRAYLDDTTLSVRNFYAALRVKQDHSYPGTTVRTLLNGSIQHGTQIFGTEELRHTPTTYYAMDSGVGYALRFCCLRPDGSLRPRNIGVIGLGAGTIAAYGQPGDRIRFFEINPAVEPIARNAFTYIRESGASYIDIIPGDARASLARSAPLNFDVLVVDAFTGDAIPLHLLTTQALALYRRNLAPGGILAFHISSQYVNLAPPIAELAASAGMQARLVSSVVDPNDYTSGSPGEFSATWVLVTDNAAFFNQPIVAEHARPIKLPPGMRVWTDDYSALLPVLRWHR
ncbi:MAG TPA: fused MFS/spermidine synthase [Terracidiphilus sp.]|nr:fused MFS/spermidine synthase [Terracidiphilus sp.]